MANVIILGGHGKVAQRATPLLVEDGHTVTSVIRSEDQVPEIEALGATALVLDLESTSTHELAKVFVDKDAVIFSAGAGGGNPDRTYAIDRDAAIYSIDAANQSSVPRYIMVSYQGAGFNHGIDPENSFYPYAQSKAEADDYLRRSGLKWTILGPGMLTLDDPSEKIALNPSADVLEKEGGRNTSRGNVAAAIVAALDEDNAAGQTLEFVDGDQDIREAFHTV